MFSVLFALANGRMGSLGPQQTSVLLAVMSYVTVFVVPALKYPPNPPSIGEPETILVPHRDLFPAAGDLGRGDHRRWLLRQRLVAQYGTWYASLVAAGAYAIVIGAFYLILPNINEVPDGFPAATLYDFRLASLGIQAVLWGSIGVIFGYVVERTMEGVGSSTAVRARVPPSPCDDGSRDRRSDTRAMTDPPGAGLAGPFVSMQCDRGAAIPASADPLRPQDPFGRCMRATRAHDLEEEGAVETPADHCGPVERHRGRATRPIGIAAPFCSWCPSCAVPWIR